MRVAIVGSRMYPDPATVARTVINIADNFPGAVVISGGAAGVDSWALHCAEALGLGTESIRPEWKRSDGTTDRGAGFRRNHEIVKRADEVIAFWDGHSRGTQHTIGIAKAANKLTVVMTPDGEKTW